jgi:Spy/CpxP family protein refolding chaperone
MTDKGQTADDRRQTAGTRQEGKDSRVRTATVTNGTMDDRGRCSLKCTSRPSAVWRLLSLVLLLASLKPAPLRAEQMGGPMMGPPPMGRMMHGDSPAMMLHMVLRQADLTPDQRTQVQKIMEADHQNLRTLFAQLQAANSQLAEKLLAPGTVQAADLAPQVQQITQLRQQLMEQGVKTALAVRAVLTPQQLAKVAKTKDRMEKLQAEMRSIFEGND